MKNILMMNLTENIQVFNEDCMVGMAKYPDNYFDLAIVDPPYGIDAPNMSMGANKSKNKSNTSTSVAKRLKKAKFSVGSGKLKNRALNSMKLDWDEAPSIDYFDELFRVSKNQIIFGGNYFDLPPTRCVICWDKVQPWENFSQWEMAWTSFNKVASLIKISNKGGNVSQLKIHPTQKPIKLYDWILKKYAEKGFKILDTHGGSLSSAIAFYYWCGGLGEFVAYELDVDYFKASTERFKEYVNKYPIEGGSKLNIEQISMF